MDAIITDILLQPRGSSTTRALPVSVSSAACLRRLRNRRRSRAIMTLAATRSSRPTTEARPSSRGGGASLQTVASGSSRACAQHTQRAERRGARSGPDLCCPGLTRWTCRLTAGAGSSLLNPFVTTACFFHEPEQLRAQWARQST